MSPIDSAVLWNNGKAYFFTGSQYVRYDVKSDRADQAARPIAAGWPGLFASGIDASVLWPNGKAYFFKGSQYVRYDVASDRVDQAARPISAGWPGVFAGGVDAVVLWPNGKAYFFKGSEYVRYDVKSDRVDQAARSIAAGWPGLFAGGIDAGLVWPNGKAYFFKGSEYVRYDVASDRVDQAARSISAGWPGLVAGGDAPASNGAGQFDFELRSGEPIGHRIVRCCSEALAGGPMGNLHRHDFYRDFITCEQETSTKQADEIAKTRTSCAMFIRAVRHWCGATASGPYKPGTGMFVSMGNVSLAHPAFVKHKNGATPNPGDYFFIANAADGVDGHTGIFIEETSPGTWRTAEGGGGGKPDGTFTRFVERTLLATSFHNDARRLHGWFDCTRVGIPALNHAKGLAQMTPIDAAVLWDNGKAYFFGGSQYTRYDVASDHVDRPPRAIADGWPGLPAGGVDAAVVWDNGKAFFFKGARYWRYDMASDGVDQAPRAIADGWAGVSFDRINAAVLWPNGKAYLFRGGQYLRYDVESDAVDRPPRPIADGWPGVFADGVDAVVLWDNGKAYFFKGTRYVRWDVASDRVDQAPREIAAGWPGLAAGGPAGNGATADLSDGFFAEVRALAPVLGCEPIDLLAVMMTESQVRATARNPVSNASGLIQFMPSTLTGMGWTQGHEAFRRLTAEEQMPFVRRFLVRNAHHRLHTAVRLYHAVFLPGTLSRGSAPETVLAVRDGLPKKVYEQNHRLDTDNDGTIVVDELQQAIDRRTRGARWTEIVARLEGS